jgi:hypothetical protein
MPYLRLRPAGPSSGTRLQEEGATTLYGDKAVDFPGQPSMNPNW